jgi:catechol 2,3-dioxygenase-like lactoylglutathione lyase family enzyme
MKLKQTRFVTRDVERLADFYETITGAGKSVGTPGYVEFDKPCEGLAIAGPAVQETYGSAVISPAANRSAILDFEVADVDKEFVRLKTIVTDWVMEPTDQAWGNRAMLFRDPDGNLINFFMPLRKSGDNRRAEHQQDI